MRKLLSWFIIVATLICVAGSIDVPVPYLPQPSGDAYIPMQGVCSAPPSLLPALCGQCPALKQVPDLIQRSKDLIDAGLPDIPMPFPVHMGEGSFIDKIIVNSAPRFL